MRIASKEELQEFKSTGMHIVQFVCSCYGYSIAYMEGMEAPMLTISGSGSILNFNEPVELDLDRQFKDSIGMIRVMIKGKSEANILFDITEDMEEKASGIEDLVELYNRDINKKLT